MYHSSSRIFLARFALFLLTGILILAACASPPPSATPVPPTLGPTSTPTATPIPLAATVNGEGLTLAEFKAELQRFKDAQESLGKTVSEQEAAGRVLEELTGQMLLAQGAREAGFTVDDEMLQARIDSLSARLGGPEALAAWQADHGYREDDFRAALRRSVAAALMRDSIASSVPETAEQVHARQILLYNEDDARKVQADLAAGRDFEALALLYDPVTGGDLGWFPRGYLLELEVEQAAFALQAGQTSDIIRTEIGYHILKILARQADRQLTPDAYLALQIQAVEGWLAQKRAGSSITIAP